MVVRRHITRKTVGSPVCPAFLAALLVETLSASNCTLEARPPSSPVQRQCLEVVRYHVTPLHIGLEQASVRLSLTTEERVPSFALEDDLWRWQAVVIMPWSSQTLDTLPNALAMHELTSSTFASADSMLPKQENFSSAGKAVPQAIMAGGLQVMRSARWRTSFFRLTVRQKRAAASWKRLKLETLSVFLRVRHECTVISVQKFTDYGSKFLCVGGVGSL